MEIIVSKVNLRSDVDTSSWGFADPTVSPSYPIPAAEPADMGWDTSCWGHLPDCYKDWQTAQDNLDQTSQEKLEATQDSQLHRFML